MCNHNIDIVDNNQSDVLDDVKLPSLIEPTFYEDPDINDNDQNIFSFNEDKEISIDSTPSLMTLF